MQKSQFNQSTKHKKCYRSSRDLVTTIEANIGSPMSEYQPHTQRNRQIKNTHPTSTKTYQDFDQQILEEIDSLFITSDQEKVVRQILQLTRKGKITNCNAFEIPIKVVNPKRTESINMKFWKLASELLNSSSQIYDKRVENLYLGSNKVMGELLRMKDDNNGQLKEMQSANKKRSVAFTDLAVIDTKLSLNSNQIKYAHTEQIQKLSWSESKRQYFRDNFLMQRAKGIDSNSLSGLMINIIEIGPDLRLELYQDHQSDNELFSDFKGKIEEKLRAYIEDQYKSLSYLLKSQQMMPQVSLFRQKYFPSSIHEKQHLQTQFSQYFHQTNPHELSRLQFNSEQTVLSVRDQPNLDFINLQEFASNTQPAKANSFTVDFRTEIASESCQGPFKKSLTLIGQEEKEQCFTIAGPWEIQFKQAKLKPKKPSKRTKKFSKQQTTQSQPEIDFSFDQVQLRENIFAIKENMSFKIESNNPQEQKFILHKAINPSLQMLRAKKLKSLAITKTQTTPIQQSPIDQQSRFLTASFHLQQELQNESLSNPSCSKMVQQTSNRAESEKQAQNLTQQQVKNFYTFGIKNIRQVKQMVFQELMCRSSIRISDIESSLAPAEMLIIFLHLVNQKNLKIQSIDSQCDARLSVYS